MFVGESFYVSFPTSFFFVFTSSHLFLESETSDHLLRALGFVLSIITFIIDVTSLRILISVDHYFSLYVHCFTIILAIAFD